MIKTKNKILQKKFVFYWTEKEGNIVGKGLTLVIHENSIFSICLTGTRLLFFTPLVLLSDLLFFGWSEIVLDIEGLADFLRSFAFDHVGDSFAGDIQKSLK